MLLPRKRRFPKIYTTTLLAGEKSGNMEEVLGRYIAFQRLALTFKKKLRSRWCIPRCWSRW